jgi:hypothetical protein
MELSHVTSSVLSLFAIDEFFVMTARRSKSTAVSPYMQYQAMA